MYHTIIIVGNLGRDPEFRYIPNGQAVCNFNVASNRQYTTSDGQSVKETTWFRVATWGKLAETCNQFLKKGHKVLIEGRLNPDAETGSPRVFTRQDGSSGASYEVTAQVVRFLTSRGEDAGYDSDEFPGAQSPEPDDIPF